MKASLLIIFLALWSFHCADARLADGYSDLVQRFGKPDSAAKPGDYGSHLLRFQKDGWIIQTWLIDGRCDQITYMKAGIPSPTTDQITALMNSNSAGFTWKRHTKDLTTGITNLILPSISQHEFVRSDQQASCRKNSNGATFKSGRWIKLESQADAAKRKTDTAVPKF